ncbi:Cyclin, C-terminal domain [Musa troglodytarum]|uniref:Cyclin, C-terminal domain n=1 Tax=Musa troglodytarum TaxID=320322 RepID=A0A9E7LDN1_9LILI|nr:Cyclin, C-terminal domain [Musa troglodytarum]
MADKENGAPRLTRAAAKRAASAQAADPVAPPLAKKKRVALSELPTLSNAVPRAAVDPTTPPPSKPKSKPKKKVEEADDEKVDLVEVAASSDDDPQMCAHYASDIYQYLKSMEVEAKRRPSPNYMETVQSDVTANMRAILVDWLVEVAEEYKLVSDTLYLTVSYIDRFLSFNAINRHRLQLLGVSSMLIASKYEEISPPNAEDFCYITDNTYTKQEVVKMESDILNFLKFEMGNPTIKIFVRLFTHAGQEDGKYPNLQLEYLGSFLAELSLLEYGCVKFLPSVVAAASNKKLEECTGYKVSDLKDCIRAILDLQLSRKAASLVAIRDKYKQHRFKCGIAIARKIWRNNITAYQKKKRNCHHRRLSLLILLHESRATSKERWEISHPRKGEASLPDLAGTFPVDTTTSIEVDSKIDDPQTCTHYATDIYAYLRSLEFSSQLLASLGSYLGELSLTDYDLQLKKKAIRWKTTGIQYKQTQFTLVVSCNLARWQSVGFGISEAIPKVPARGAHAEADVAPSWENQHRKAFRHGPGIKKRENKERQHQIAGPPPLRVTSKERRQWISPQERRAQAAGLSRRLSGRRSPLHRCGPCPRSVGDPSPKKDVAVSQDVRLTPQARSAIPSITAEHIQRAPGLQSPKKEVAKPDHPVTSQAGTAPSSAADCIQGASGSHCGHKKDGTGPPDIPGTSLAEPAPSISADCNQGASGDQSSKKDNARPSDLPDASQAATAPLDLCGLHPRSVGRSVFQENRFQVIGPPWHLPGSDCPLDLCGLHPRNLREAEAISELLGGS